MKPLRALRRWLAFLRLVHGRGVQRLRQRIPPAFGDARLARPDHYPTRAGQLLASRADYYGD